MALLPAVSFAAINVNKDSNGGSIMTSNNAYMAGATINIGESSGDVYAAGGTVASVGKIGQDLVAVGGNIAIDSAIGGDLRLAGGNINISGPVNGELFVAGGQVNVARASAVKGDFIVAGGAVNIGGSMNGNGKIYGNAIDISGVLNKDVDIKAKNLVIASTAVVNGNINYSGVTEAVIKEGAKVNGKISFTKIEDKTANTAGLAVAFGAFWFIKLLGMLAAALILFFLMKRNILNVAKEGLNNFWKELLRGFAVMILVPAAVIILFITIIGFAVGVFGAALYFLLLILAGAFSGILFAEIINRLIFQGKKEKALNWLMVVLGVIVLQLIGFIPFVGWIAEIIIFLAALGVVSNLIFRKAKTFTE